MEPSRVRVRYAPSPTGYLHIGALRTALYNELMARHHGGDFILRIEDTDQKRYVPGSIERLCISLKQCGVIPNEGVWIDDAGNLIERGDVGPYLQTKRKDIHLAYAQQLIEMGKAYHCFCTEERLATVRQQQEALHQPTMYDRHCRALSPDEVKTRLAAGESHVIRLAIPSEGSVTFTDLIRGTVTINWEQVDDQVIIKSDGLPTYHLANTCDDHDQRITHVLRGEEWVSSTPKHLFIYQAFGWTPPVFAHVPLLLNADRSKLSKRQGDVAVEDYLAKGYLPDAMVNFVALLGWNPKGDQEIYTKQELIELFDLTKVNKSGAVVNFEKLDWMNAQYIKAMTEEVFVEMARGILGDVQVEDALLLRALRLIRDRVVRTMDIPELVKPYLGDEVSFANVSITWKTQSKEDAKVRLEALATLIEGLDESVVFERAAIEEKIKALITEKGWGNGDTLWPLRVALSGAEKSPGPFDLLATFGKEASLKRIRTAVASL